MSIRPGWLPLILALAGILACGAAASSSPDVTPPPGSDSVKVALNDLGSKTYLGFQGGLYPGGSNTAPSAHSTVGLARAKAIRKLDANGNPSASGKYVLLSIGMSNTTQEFCNGNNSLNCLPETFMGRAAADPEVDKTRLVLVDGAQGGREASDWISPSAATFDIVRDQRLTRLGVTEKQVQAVWVKSADAQPTKGLPGSSADAYVLEERLASMVRAMKVRYPNLQQVFITSRAYAGYASSTLNPEPYAYESGFSVKWLIQAQIDQAEGGTIVDTRAGDLSYGSIAPWVAWGPYPWANGTTARTDGLQWFPADFKNDGTHPSESGRSKVGAMLITFFKTSAYTRCWFIAGGSC